MDKKILMYVLYVWSIISSFVVGIASMLVILKDPHLRLMLFLTFARLIVAGGINIFTGGNDNA